MKDYESEELKSYFVKSYKKGFADGVAAVAKAVENQKKERGDISLKLSQFIYLFDGFEDELKNSDHNNDLIDGVNA